MDERSRRPKHSPKRAPQAQEARILAVRDDHPVWGARKIAHVLRRDSGIILAPSTVNSILRRHGRISAEAGRGPSQASARYRDRFCRGERIGNYEIGRASCRERV